MPGTKPSSGLRISKTRTLFATKCFGRKESDAPKQQRRQRRSPLQPLRRPLRRLLPMRMVVGDLRVPRKVLVSTFPLTFPLSLMASG
jgi:hypothetical protein